MQQPQQPQQQLNIDLRNSENVKCEKCENVYFTPVVLIKKVSALISPTGEEILAPVQTFQCSSCTNVNEQFLIESLP
tara:strand:+ start:253 stop:483 length:231 start_codon:yes stop_codon:yes gene_type:complete